MIRDQAEEHAIKAKMHVYDLLEGESTRVTVENEIEKYKNSNEIQEYRCNGKLIEYICHVTNYKNRIVNLDTTRNEMGLCCYCATEAFPEYKNEFQKLFIATWRSFFS